MKKLLVTIPKNREFDDRNCLRCRFIVYTCFHPYCYLFQSPESGEDLIPDIQVVGEPPEWFRCKECLKAEVK